MIKKFQKTLILLLLTLTTLISTAFLNPKPAYAAADPFIGEVSLFPYNFAPLGWYECSGQMLNINSNQALFALLGTTYGGDGRTTFALPDLRGASPLPDVRYYIALNGIFPSRS